MTSNELKSSFVKISSDAKNLAKDFLNLSYKQINFRPSESQWSIGECFEHLIRTNEKYIPVYEKYKLSEGDKEVDFKPTLTGKLITKSVLPDNKRKFKTSSPFNPIGSSINVNIVKDFLNQNEKLVETAKNIDSAKMKEKISSPFSKFVKYNVGDSLLVIGNHNLRHIHQAKRVMLNENFPSH
jgi:hypothetical protein